jgi:hypothetical protein
MEALNSAKQQGFFLKIDSLQINKTKSTSTTVFFTTKTKVTA